MRKILTKPFKRFEGEVKDTNGFEKYNLTALNKFTKPTNERQKDQVLSSFLPAFSTPIFPSHLPRSSVFFCCGFFSGALVRLLRSLEKERTATQASFNSFNHFLVTKW